MDADGTSLERHTTLRRIAQNTQRLPAILQHRSLRPGLQSNLHIWIWLVPLNFVLLYVLTSDHRRLSSEATSCGGLFGFNSVFGRVGGTYCEAEAIVEL